jgi:hypothetical protein
MTLKQLRHFLCGLLLGAGGVYWFTFYTEETFDSVFAWLQETANVYRAKHPVPKADIGWGPAKRQQ